MKRITRYLYFWCFIFSIFYLSSCNTSSKPEKKTVQYGEATQQLVNMLDTNPELKGLLITSIEKAKQANPDTNTNPVQSLDKYFAFASRAETSVPWAIIKSEPGSSPMENLFKTLCQFYFVVDQPLPELEGKGYARNSLQYTQPFGTWLTKFNVSWRKFLDSKQSWNDSSYQLFLKDTVFGLQKGWYEDPARWATFNQFFSRKLSSAAARPIASPNDDAVVASFADAEPQGVWEIDSNSNIKDKDGVPVKSATIKSVAQLIGDDSQYKNAFANGTFTHSFLDVNDYHRYHLPIGGTVKEVRVIQGIAPTGGTITWDAGQKRYAFNTSAAGWQMIETRGCVIVETEKYGLVALLPIGMAAVGSVNFEDNIKVGAKLHKGDMLGYFLFGGSDFIMLFQHNVNFTLDSPKKAGQNGYRHILMGERLGHLARKS
jgi:phosphatidylserine decarboxylase precursor